MKTITLLCQKGGSGKSTIAINLAVAAARSSKRTLLIDLDPQGTAEHWYQDREADKPSLLTTSSKQLPEALDRAKQSGVDVVIIDTAGREDPASSAAIKQSDFCLVPCRPSPADMKATPPTVAGLNRQGRPFAFVITQCPPRGPRFREAQVGLGMLGSVAPIPIVQRAAYQDAQGMGQGVIEFQPDGKAARETLALWQWLVRRIKKLEHD